MHINICIRKAAAHSEARQRLKSTMQLPMDGKFWVVSGAPMPRVRNVREGGEGVSIFATRMHQKPAKVCRNVHFAMNHGALESRATPAKRRGDVKRSGR